MNKSGKEASTSNYKDRSFKNRNDPYEKVVENNSDDDFQSTVLFRKRNRNNTQSNNPQPKRLKDKGASTYFDQPSGTQDEVNNTSKVDFYVESEFSLLSLANPDDYDFDNNGEFQEFIAQRSVLSESSKPTHPLESFKGSSTSTASMPNPTKNFDTTRKRVMTVKASIKNIWKREYIQPLYDLVNITNMIVTHTFAFSKYIFLKELTTNSDFILNEFVRKDFFVEVFLALTVQTGTKRTDKLKDMTAKYRQLISQYKGSYFEDATYTPPKLLYAQQIALYECTKIQTAYLNNINDHFGNKLRALVNKLCEKKKRAETIRKEMISEAFGEKEIKEAIHKRVYNPCNQVKLAVERKDILPEVDILNNKAKSVLRDFLSTYPKEYKFKKNSIFYDVKANPENHLKAFYKITELFESEQLKQFACFPLRTTFIPCYMTLDSKIIHHHIIKSKKVPIPGSKFETWGTVANLQNKSFKDQGPNKSLCFQGTIETDGVGVSIIKQNTSTSRKVPLTMPNKGVIGDETTYIEDLTQTELIEMKGKCVLMDPGRRDLLYCMKETSTVSDKQILVYSKNTRTKISRYFKILRKKTKPDLIKVAEVTLSKTSSSSVNLESYLKYIKERASLDTLLTGYYGNETLRAENMYFADRCFQFNVNNKGDLYFGNLFVTKIRGHYPQPETNPDLPTQFQMYAIYIDIMLQQSHISNRLTNDHKAALAKLMTNINSEIMQHVNTILQKLQILPFRKLKMVSKIYHLQNDQQLVKKIVQKFGKESVLILGNWSSPSTKYQEPSRSIGLINMLKKNGLTLYLIDEYKTSLTCPTCEGNLDQKFKKIRNPRPYQRAKLPTVKCHGLTRCRNGECAENQNKLWNRDLAAVLNYKKILLSLRETGKRPHSFIRNHTM